MDTKISKMEVKLAELGADFAGMKCKLGLDKNINGQVQGTQSHVGGGEGLDRKRLKERFKKALKLDSDPLANIPKAPSAWMEFIFGIGAPDQRMGKEGSRFHTKPDVCASFAH